MSLGRWGGRVILDCERRRLDEEGNGEEGGGGTATDLGLVSSEGEAYDRGEPAVRANLY